MVVIALKREQGSPEKPAGMQKRMAIVGTIMQMMVQN